MSNAVFPTLPGLGWSVGKRPNWTSRVAGHVSGREVRAAYMAYPLWDFELTYEVLRAGAQYQELQTLMGFFLERKGQFDTFLFNDPSDNTAAGQALGTGDGVTTVFPFVRSLGGFVEPVLALQAVTSVYVNGTPTAAYTLQAGPIGVNSILSMNAAPASGAAISADFKFYFNCRFADDAEDFENFMDRLWTLKSCKLRSVKV